MSATPAHASLELRVVDAIADVDRQAWDALLDARATPFESWTFLEALEHSGCTSPSAGWRPRHLTLWRGDRLIAAAPAYAKLRADGADFARDWHWADASERAGLRYYPKLVLCVPITPVTGRRLLVLAGEDRQACVRALLAGAHELAREERLSGVHVLYPLEDESAELEAAGMARRIDFQAHWRNRGYGTFDDWLGSLDSKRRNQTRRERRAVVESGLTVRTVRGPELAAEATRWGRDVYGLFRSTLDKIGWWGTERLNEEFFTRLFTGLPGPLEVVEARRGTKLIAGAFNASTATHLYGRYWGAHEEHPFLHFGVCLYHSIDDCIARGLQVFEGGAGGQHKIHKGFDLAATYSNHSFLDPRLDAAMRGHIELECQAREAELAAFEATRKRPAGGAVEP